MSQIFHWYSPSLLLLTWTLPRQDSNEKCYRRRISVFCCIHHTSNWRSGSWGASCGVAWLVLSFVAGRVVCWQTGKGSWRRLGFHVIPIWIIQIWLAAGMGMRNIRELEYVCLNLPSSDNCVHTHTYILQRKEISSALDTGSIWGMALEGYVKWILLDALRSFPCLSAFLQELGCIVPLQRIGIYGI